MEWFLADCAAALKGNMPVFLSLGIAGLLGSLSHCSMMCSPLVAAQMLDIKNRKQSQLLMLFYHLGRLTTYAVLGAVAVLAAGWLFSARNLQLTHGMMLLAGVIFIISAITPRQTHPCSRRMLNQQLEQVASPRAVYFLRGVLMGFMPCGMVVAALMLTTTLTSPLQAATGMALFGLGTTPILQLTGAGALRLSHYYPHSTQLAGRGAMALNGLFLCAIGMNLVTIS